MKKTTLLIMAAGLGSRYGGDKQVDRIGPDGEILMQYSIFDALKAGFNKIVIVIKPSYKDLLSDILSNFTNKGIEICYAYQDFSSVPSFYDIPKNRIKPFGTVHALLCAKDLINEPFAVINADDFYGADAYCVMYSSLTKLSENSASMVAYPLKNTVSPNGTVTRGICKTANGRLSHIDETYDIALNADGTITSSSKSLDAALPVSMNMWGFTPEIFSIMQKDFEAFLKSIPEGDIKAEFVLPTFIDKQIKMGNLCVNVFNTSAHWFGVTYREDRDAVEKKLALMKENGEYPEKLIYNW